ncbi:MAG: molybdopterin cofactor-binding domain-containing protein, partial [Candidatus Thermoplasmatota archaeon]|nr:molybdopterin cofactor-binding domain-containing protein [Candidatus Thermoplasmatota archaeon]
CGKALNPLAVKGQIIGSCHMGMGQVLSEEMRYGRNGHLMNPDLLDYKIPSVHEMPEVIPIIVESNDPEGPFGAKEAGEGPLLPILPAVCNAVYDAVGVRASELPITPERVHKMIEKRCKSEGVSDPLDLECPRLNHSDLQDTLEERAKEHSERDRSRRLDEDISDYHNGALFGLDPTIPPDEADPNWEIRVVPGEDYLESPRLAGSAWKHTERRHRGDLN